MMNRVATLKMYDISPFQTKHGWAGGIEAPEGVSFWGCDSSVAMLTAVWTPKARDAFVTDDRWSLDKKDNPCDDIVR